MVIPAVEAGLQRGTLIMQPAEAAARGFARTAIEKAIRA